MTTSELTEHRAIIKFCVNLDKTPVQTLKMMEQANLKPKVCRSLVFRWHKRYRDGRESLSDDKRSGRPALISDYLVAQVKNVIDLDRRQTIREVADVTDVSVGTVYTIITEHLGMKKGDYFEKV